MRERFEAGDTVQFTFVTSVPPDTVPLFTMVGSGNTVVGSITAQQSDGTAFYAMVTMPSSDDGVYLGEWSTSKTVSGDLYPFKKRFLFNVTRTVRSN